MWKSHLTLPNSQLCHYLLSSKKKGKSNSIYRQESDINFAVKRDESVTWREFNETLQVLRGWRLNINSQFGRCVWKSRLSIARQAACDKRNRLTQRKVSSLINNDRKTELDQVEIVSLNSPEKPFNDEWNVVSSSSSTEIRRRFTQHQLWRENEQRRKIKRSKTTTWQVRKYANF